MSNSKIRPMALIVMDGFGCNPDSYGNAVAAAKTPSIDALKEKYPCTTILTSGLDVGLPEGQMGNSEVGHTNIGAGRIVYQELTRISKSIADGDFFTNPELVGAVKHCADNNTALHLMGLVSDGGVHSHNTHLYALLRLAKLHGLERVYIHCFMDGRDVLPSSGAGFIDELYCVIKELGVGSIATISGRYYAMDRDNRWERVEKAYAALVYGEGEKISDCRDVLPRSYENGVTDEFVVPAVCDASGMINENDAVIFFNFRPDRARQITRALVDPDFDKFERRRGFIKLRFVCMTQYDALMPNVSVAYHPQTLSNTFGEYVSGLGLKQLRMAETEKYAHVTFFFNGGVEAVYEGEDRVLIPSPKVATYDLKPEMSAYEVTDEAVERVRSGKYDAIILNYANCDMVGHTGVFEAAVKAVETVDECVGRLVGEILAAGGAALITADHGNADKMKEPDGSPNTAHTTTPVPLIAAGMDIPLSSGGRLCDLAPTMLDIMGLPKPAQMTGRSLLVR